MVIYLRGAKEEDIKRTELSLLGVGGVGSDVDASDFLTGATDCYIYIYQIRSMW
jgi:hypothetical protein